MEEKWTIAPDRAREEVRRASEDRSAIAEGNLAVLVKRWRGARRDAGAD